MASDPPPLAVEDNIDEDFFDKLVNDDDDVDFKVTRSLTVVSPNLTDGNESDEATAFANLTINELDNNGDVNFDNITDNNRNRVDDLSAQVEPVEDTNEAKEESGNPLLSSRLSEFDDSMQKVENEIGHAEVLSDVTVLSKGSSGSGVPGVKEVDWSVFHADSSENDNNDFLSNSDFLSEFGEDNAGVVFGNRAGDISNSLSQVAIGDDVRGFSNVNNSISYEQPYSAGYKDGIAVDQSSIIQEQYPGWQYDPSTGQWYQIDGYDADSSGQANSDSNISSIGKVADQKTAQSVVGAVTEFGTIESVSKLSDASETTSNWAQVSQVSSDSNAVMSDWNQASHNDNGYPPHMVFDPQYPGWYYDTITQNWHTLESYNALALSTAETREPMNQDSYAPTDTFVPNSYSEESSTHGQVNGYISQGLDQNWVGPVSIHNQKNSRMWPSETVASSEATSVYNGNKVIENNYGQNVSVSTHGSQQSSIHYEVEGSHYEDLRLGQSDFSMPSRFVVDRNLSRHFNDSIIDQNDQKLLSHKNQNSVNYLQQQIQNAQISYAPASGRSSAGRPAHALVAFGFGGRLIVMKRNNLNENLNFTSQDPMGSSISVLNLAELVNVNIDTSNHGMVVHNYFQALYQQPLPGPLTSGSVGTKELNKWIDERIKNLMSADMDYRSAEVLRLLLSLLKIACQYYGNLRSPYGTEAILKENEAPESAVAKLFVSAKRTDSQFRQYGAVTHCLQQLPSEGQMQMAAAEVQNLLASGRKKDALRCSQEGQLWGLALVLAAQLGDQFYAETVKQMAFHQLVAGSPLRTLCLLIAGQPADVFSAESTPISSTYGAVNMSQQPMQFGANSMLDDWEENLATITANRTKDDELVIIHLGDCLWKDRSNIIAAHICYLIAEASFEPYSDSARMCLVGADHWKFPRTYASPEAIQRTEVYEYSKMLGNSQFVLLPFQPYKFVYALMLAEIGRISEALKYCQAILKSLKTGQAPEVETLRHLVSSLEERIKAHQQGGFSTNLAPKEFIGKLLNLIDSTAHRVVGGPPPPSVSTTFGTIHGNENHYQSLGPKVSIIQSSRPMTPLVPSQSMEPLSDLAADRNRMSMQTRSISEPHFERSPTKGQADSSKEASSIGLQDKASAAGIKSRFGRFGFGSQLLQKTVSLVLKPQQGRQAKLGESNKFYYDEKLKRWVEEGAEPPAEEAALPPPPPTTAVFQNGTSESHLKTAVQSEAFHSNGSLEFKSPSSLDNNSAMPPLPPTTNQYSVRGRIGVRSRYVDTFNQGGGNAMTTFQSPSVPSVKPASGVNPKFFVPAPVSTVDQPVDVPANDELNTSFAHEKSCTSPLNDSFQSTASPPLTMQRFASMNNISNKGPNDYDSFSINSRRAASWSGSLNDSFSPPYTNEVKPLVQVLSTHPSSASDPSLVYSSVNGGSFRDDLHEVKL